MEAPNGVLDFIAEVTWGDLPQEVRRQPKLCLLDMSGAMPIMFDGRGVSASGVALAGGMTIDALDGYDGFNPTKWHAG